MSPEEAKTFGLIDEVVVSRPPLESDGEDATRADEKKKD